MYPLLTPIIPHFMPSRALTMKRPKMGMHLFICVPHRGCLERFYADDFWFIMSKTYPPNFCVMTPTFYQSLIWPVENVNLGFAVVFSFREIVFPRIFHCISPWFVLLNFQEKNYWQRKVVPWWAVNHSCGIYKLHSYHRYTACTCLVIARETLRIKSSGVSWSSKSFRALNLTRRLSNDLEHKTATESIFFKICTSVAKSYTLVSADSSLFECPVFRSRNVWRWSTQNAEKRKSKIILVY